MSPVRDGEPTRNRGAPQRAAPSPEVASESGRRRAAVALTATLAIQIYVSLAATATAVLAPEIAQSFAVEPRWIGVFIGLLYAGAMFASLASGPFIERFGAIRVSQACVALCVAGTVAIATASAHALPLLAMAALTIGIGYGPITPASSHVLIRTAPPERIALTFSIKQTGVPAGAALAGAMLPGFALLVDWRLALLTTAALGLAVAVAAQPTRATLDVDRKPGHGHAPASVFKPLRTVCQSRALIELALIALVYAATQVCLTSFLVVYLTETLAWSLVGAGLALAVTTAGGVAGRIVWGWVADRLLPPRRVLGIVGLSACACGAATALAQPSWPAAGFLALAALFGATAIGWNGVQLAEVARHAPPGTAGAVTGATGFIGFSGVVLGPPLFALLATFTGSYRAGFAVFAILSGVAAVALLRDRARPGERSRQPSR
jgi:MFS family permease